MNLGRESRTTKGAFVDGTLIPDGAIKCVGFDTHKNRNVNLNCFEDGSEQCFVVVGQHC
jgi:hypothetical protein